MKYWYALEMREVQWFSKTIGLMPFTLSTLADTFLWNTSLAIHPLPTKRSYRFLVAPCVTITGIFTFTHIIFWAHSPPMYKEDKERLIDAHQYLIFAQKIFFRSHYWLYQTSTNISKQQMRNHIGLENDRYFDLKPFQSISFNYFILILLTISN